MLEKKQQNTRGKTRKKLETRKKFKKFKKV
jgi:hypothetical protein